MRIATWNVGGLRAAVRKGFLSDVRRVRPDVLLLQEVRALPEQLPPNIAAPSTWKVAWHPAQKLGYAGTGVWSRQRFAEVRRGYGPDDVDGRVLDVVIDGIRVVCVYLPSGSASPASQARKDAFCASFLPWAASLASSSQPVVIGGDLNVAPTAMDIHDPKANAKNSGFLPHERAWFGDLLATGLVDLVRPHIGPGPGPYSWWSNRGRARVEDRGWRIDHLLGNAAAAERVLRGGIDRAAALTTSDHAPVWIDLADPPQRPRDV